MGADKELLNNKGETARFLNEQHRLKSAIAPAPAPAPAPASAAAKVCEFCDAQPYSRFAPTRAYLQAAAAARIVGKPDVIDAAGGGDIELVKDHVMADAGCVLKAGGRAHGLVHPYNMIFQIARTAAVRFNFLIYVISGHTALMYCIWCCINRSPLRGHLDVIRFLVESKANLEATGYGYKTPNHDFSNRAHRCSSVQFL
jgi:hypothetical protein